MNEELQIIKNYILDNNLLSLIIPIALPFTLFHFFMKFVRNIKTEIYKYDSFELKKLDDNNTETVKDIPYLPNDIVLSNDKFIKF